jgi:glucokinase
MEAYASGSSISGRYGELSGRLGVTANDVAARAEAGEPVARQVWSDAVGALAIGLAGCASLLDPELIVLGGGVASAGERLVGPLAERLADELRFEPAPGLRTAQLGERAGWIGAALAGWRAVGAEPGEVARWEL